ncbi:MAG: hypothetical protein R2830_04750 [Saprospiraceae bacterium]
MEKILAGMAQKGWEAGIDQGIGQEVEPFLLDAALNAEQQGDCSKNCVNFSPVSIAKFYAKRRD